MAAHMASGYHADMREGALGLDPRTHLPVLAAASVAALVVKGLAAAVALQAACALYLALNGRARLAAVCCAWFAALAALSFVPLPGLYGVLLVSLVHMVPPFTCACALLTLSPSAIMAAFARWHVLPSVNMGVCMAFRFAVVLPQEARQVVQGIRMRGVFPRASSALAHPALAYECLYTPLVMRVLRISSEQAASAELRGMDAAGLRASTHHVGFTWRDGAAIAAMAAFAATACLTDAMPWA